LQRLCGSRDGRGLAEVGGYSCRGESSQGVAGVGRGVGLENIAVATGGAAGGMPPAARNSVQSVSSCPRQVVGQGWKGGWINGRSEVGRRGQAGHLGGEYHSNPGDGRCGEGRIRPPGYALGGGSHGPRLVVSASYVRFTRPGVGGQRPLHFERGARIHVVVCTAALGRLRSLSLIHISEPTRLRRISYAVF